MAHYYDCNGTPPSDASRTRIPMNVLENHSVDEFIDLCEQAHGVVIAEQAHALLIDRAFCDDQNYNALARIKGLAMDNDEWELAMSLGVYFDRLSY